MQEPANSHVMHWEDVVIGETVPFGSTTVTREQIVEFACAFDPQPFHLDEEAAKQSMVGRLFASGWHSCAIFMRMMAEEVLNKAASLGSPGVEEVKWLKPVVPGDRLSGATHAWRSAGLPRSLTSGVSGSDPAGSDPVSPATLSPR